MCPKCKEVVSGVDLEGRPGHHCKTQNRSGSRSSDILPRFPQLPGWRFEPRMLYCYVFMSLCRKGDVTGIARLLERVDANNAEGAVIFEKTDENSKWQVENILLYQHPGLNLSSLHVAVMAGQEKVALLMLFLGSIRFLHTFPKDIQRLGLHIRGNIQKGSTTDIRSLRDIRGSTAEDMARRSRETWCRKWVRSGLLKPPEV